MGVFAGGNDDGLKTAILFLVVGLWVLVETLPFRKPGWLKLLVRGTAVASLLSTLFSVDVAVPWPWLEEISAGICVILFAFAICNAGRWPPPVEDDKSSPT